jgi:hypothetical protein
MFNAQHTMQHCTCALPAVHPRLPFNFMPRTEVATCSMSSVCAQSEQRQPATAHMLHDPAGLLASMP